MEKEEKTYVEDIDRSIYDIKDEEKDAFKLEEGLTPDIVAADFQRRKRIRPGWSFSVCSLCRFTMN